ncbi:MAG: ABC transporter substrate-binding protein [bacterium]
MKRLVVLVLLVATLSIAANGEMTKVSIGMGYIPNVQFAPFYVALDKGYFSEEGLEVTLDFSNPYDAPALLTAGRVEFIAGDGEQVIISRSKGLPLVYLAAIYVKYPIAIASLEERNIREPKDLIGKILGVPGFYGSSLIGMKAILKGAGVEESKINIVPIGFTQSAAIDQGRVDAAVVYINNEPVQLRHFGKRVNVIPSYEYIDAISTGLISTDGIIKSKPEVARKVVKAFLRGLKFTMENPEEAVDITIKFVPEAAEKRDLQLAVLRESIKLYESDYTRQKGLGWSDPKSWSATQDFLFEIGIIDKKVDVGSLFTHEFLP